MIGRLTVYELVILGMAFIGTVAGAGTPAVEREPPLDLLEFLGTWQTPNGKAIDPFDLDDTEGVPSAKLRSNPQSEVVLPEDPSYDRSGRKARRQQDHMPEEPHR